MQVVIHVVGNEAMRLLLPPAEVNVVRGVAWGRHDEIGSPAYWAAQSWMWGLDEPDHYRLGRTLGEELLACMLGGYGIPAEVGLAAYDRLRPSTAGGAERLCDEAYVHRELSRPLHVCGRDVRYRFANQKARYVSAAFRELGDDEDGLADRALRDRLVSLPGVGAKTASWVVRNLRGSDEVAILDIHLLRAGRMLGIFDDELTVDRHYPQLEAAFLRFAAAIGARASILDSVIWMTMRRLPRPVLSGMLAGARAGAVQTTYAEVVGLAQ